MEKKISCVWHGEDSSSPSAWLSWLVLVDELLAALGLKVTHYGVEGEGFASGKVLSANRVKKRLLKAIESGASIATLEAYSLPDNYQTAIFDSNAVLAKTNRYVLGSVREDFLQEWDSEKWAERLRAGIENPSRGEIFELDADQVAMSYVEGWKAKHPGLRVLKKFLID